MGSLQSVTERLLAVDWETWSDRRPERIALMREFLRRSAHYAQAFGCNERWPFFDVAAVAVPNCPEVPLPTALQQLGLPTLTRDLAQAMLRWAAHPLRELGTLPPDPYEPLLRFFELGGGFSVENRMVDVDAAAIPIRDQAAYLRDEPFVELAESTDAEPAPEAVTPRSPVALSPEQRQSARARWRDLLAEPDGPKRVHTVALEITARAVKDPLGDPVIAMAGPDEALAGCAVLRGGVAAATAFDTFAILVSMASSLLGAKPQESRLRAALHLLTMEVVAQSCGRQPNIPDFNAAAWREALWGFSRLSPEEHLLVALLAAHAGNFDQARLRLEVARIEPEENNPLTTLGQGVLWVINSAQQPPIRREVESGWEVVLARFSEWLTVGRADFRHLVLAANLILSRLLDIPVGEVADALHQSVVVLAAESEPAT